MRQLEPPGFLALNCGYQTPVLVLIAHVAYASSWVGLESTQPEASVRREQTAKAWRSSRSDYRV